MKHRSPDGVNDTTKLGNRKEVYEVPVFTIVDLSQDLIDSDPKIAKRDRQRQSEEINEDKFAKD